MIVLDAVSLWATGVAGWLAESRCVKREVSRPQVADGYGHGKRSLCALLLKTHACLLDPMPKYGELDHSGLVHLFLN